MIQLIWFIAGGLLTAIVYIAIIKYQHRKRYTLPFLDILEHAKDGRLKFSKRFGDIIYFSGYDDLDIVYNIRTHNISVFKELDCLLTAVDSMSKINDEIIDTLVSKFYINIYKDVTILNGVVYSNNLVGDGLEDLDDEVDYITTPNGDKVEPMVEFLLEEDYIEDDDVLEINALIHKVKMFGIDSLNEEEKVFINDTRNW